MSLIFYFKFPSISKYLTLHLNSFFYSFLSFFLLLFLDVDLVDVQFDVSLIHRVLFAELLLFALLFTLFHPLSVFLFFDVAVALSLLSFLLFFLLSLFLLVRDLPFFWHSNFAEPVYSVCHVQGRKDKDQKHKSHEKAQSTAEVRVRLFCRLKLARLL